MSGIMSFTNNNSVLGSGSTVQASLGNGSVMASRNEYSGHDSRFSLSLSEDYESPTSFQNGGDEKFREHYQDKDVWGSRIILSSLEEITFSDSSYPKLSSEIKHNIQKFLLALNGVTSKVNPFGENHHKSASSSMTDNYTLVEGSKLRGYRALEIPKDVLDTLGSLPMETKIVVRSLISSYVRKICAKIVETWKPILEADGITLPALKSNTSKSKFGVGPPKRRGSEGGSLSLEDYDLEACLQLILDGMRIYQKESKELDLKVRDQMKTRDEQLFKYERDMKALNQINLGMLQLKVAMEEPEFVSSYMDILELENSVIEEQLRLEQLKLEADKKSEEEQKMREELHNKVKALYEQMEAEAQEIEDRIAKYKSLGQDYGKIQEQYKGVEEEISTKEWVKEQLLNGPKNESLLNASL